LSPVAFITLTFKSAQTMEGMKSLVGILIAKYSRVLKSHVFPLVSYNMNDKGRVKNDLHIIILTDSSMELSCQLSKLIRYHDKRPDWKINGILKSFPFTNKCMMTYDSDKHAVHYLTLRHKEVGIVMGCPNRERRCKKLNCKYRADYRLLLTDAFKERYTEC